jgi:hypothetical protein
MRTVCRAFCWSFRCERAGVCVPVLDYVWCAYVCVCVCVCVCESMSLCAYKSMSVCLSVSVSVCAPVFKCMTA